MSGGVKPPAIARERRVGEHDKDRIENWMWEVKLDGLVGQFVHLTTTDGLGREGLITGVRTLQLPIDGIIREIPHLIELNHDSADQVEFTRMASMQLR